MKNILIILITFLTITGIIYSNIHDIDYDSNILYLDEDVYITCIIENTEQDIKYQYIRTLTVDYKDKLDKPIKLHNGDKLYNRCSFESQLVMYSESDSLVLNSWKRMSCEITAFFNLTQRDSEWLKYHVVNSITIKNITTNYCKNYKNEQPLFFNNIIKKYNSNTKLD